jgi:hypothetical protein
VFGVDLFPKFLARLKGCLGMRNAQYLYLNWGTARFEDDVTMNETKEEEGTALSNGQKSRHCPGDLERLGESFHSVERIPRDHDPADLDQGLDRLVGPIGAF